MTLSGNDLNQIENVVDRKLDEKLDEKLSELKSDFYDHIDPILKEVVNAREERTLVENRLEELENIHPGGSHTVTS